MRVATWLMAGAIFAATTGAITGIAFNTTPIKNHSDARGTLPDHPAPSMSRDLASQSAHLPDHYALITPEGRIEVEELGSQGRYRDQRLEQDGYADPLPEPAYYGDYEYPAEPGAQVQAADPREIQAVQSNPPAPEQKAPKPVMAEAAPAPRGPQPAQSLRGGPKVIEFPAGMPTQN